MNKFLLLSALLLTCIFTSCDKEPITQQDESEDIELTDTNLEVDTRSASDAVVIINSLITQVKQLYQNDLITKAQKNYLVRKLKKIRKKLNQGQINKAITRIDALIYWLECSTIDSSIVEDLVTQLKQAKCEALPVDEDGDGFLCNEDCDDTDPDINPDQTETPGNGIDDNCNGEVDEVFVCTGADGYNAISLSDIMNTPLSAKVLDGSDNVYNEIPAGTVVVYNTNEGRYGKLLIQTLDVFILMSWTTYNADGTVYSQGSDLNISGTWHADLDAGVQTTTNGTEDFWWEAVDGIDRFVVPSEDATFAIYTCEEAEPEECTGDFVFGSINYHDILCAELSTDDINGSDNASNQIPTGTIVLYSTNSGNVGKLLITDYGQTLTIKYRTYMTNGVTASENAAYTIPQTVTVDLDTGVNSDFPISDIWWQNVDGVERYLTPLDGSAIALFACPAE